MIRSWVATNSFLIGKHVFLLAIFAGCKQDIEPRQPTADHEYAIQSTDHQVSELIRRGDTSAASLLIRQSLARNPADIVAIERLGDISEMEDNFLAAAELYSSAIQSTTNPSASLFKKWHQSLLKGGLPYEAVEALQLYLEEYPDLEDAHYNLAGLSVAMGVPRSALPSLRWLVLHGKADIDTLMLLIDPDRAEPDLQTCKELLERFPDHHSLQYPLALEHVNHGRWNLALEITKQILSKTPHFAPAQLLYGKILLAQGKFDEFQHWRDQVSSDLASYRQFWELVGDNSRLNANYQDAIRSYSKSLDIEDWESPALLQGLYMSLKNLRQDKDADLVGERLELATKTKEALQVFLERKAQSKLDAMRIAEPLAKMGRVWEAIYWLRLAQQFSDKPQPGLTERFTEYRDKLAKESTWRTAGSSLAQTLNLTELTASLPIEASNLRPIQAVTSSIYRDIFLKDEAFERGWQTECKLSADTERVGHWIYQSLGGGAAVIDYDLNGWPDLINAVLDGQPFTKSCGPNRLFRNLQGHFQEVTNECRYLDHQFSQGITVGDMNQDGFADIYDCNIGSGRLYVNCGDGTFTEQIVLPDARAEGWATSAAIVDLDGDGLSDLFETHYCAGPEPFEHACRNDRRLLSTCSPLLFPAERDRVWRNDGTGKLVDVSEQWLSGAEPGRGLGLIAGHLDEVAGMDIYVANDMTLNHLWSGRQDDLFRLSEHALSRGIANNAQAVSQASMGIAADDADGDGDLDFFVTHFSDDYNTFYEQVSPGFWSDRSVALSLAEPSYAMLGFGTQFIDFNNDGTLEIFVSNGHIDDLGRSDIGYRMRPQIFSRLTNGQWMELDPKSLGNYCDSQHLGRAVTVLDADRNGLPDLAITHLYEPASLLMNKAPTGNGLRLRLVATHGSRDAIGTSIRCRAGEQTWTRQLLAGNGYMASNERVISFGIGERKSVDEVEIQWASGWTQTIAGLSAGDYLIVENEAGGFEWGL